MARIRTIKPEFWDSPGTARASLQARLFFIAMWNWADDWGIGTANPSQLMSFAFPNDEYKLSTDFPSLRTEVAECFDVQWYEVDSRPYFAIPSWDLHQKNERRSAKRNPTPDQGKLTDAEMRGISVRTDGKNTLGTGEQGNRGTVKEHAHLTASVTFDDFWNLYPKKNGKAEAVKAWAKAVKKADPQQIIDAVRAFAESPYRPEKQFIPYGATWLNQERWNDPPPEPPEDKNVKLATQPTALPDYSRRPHEHRFDVHGMCIKPGCEVKR